MSTRRYLLQLGGFAMAGLLAIAMLNILVDPHNVFQVLARSPWDSSKVRAAERTSKAEIARRGRADVILVGDSRVMVGINPDHPGLRSHGEVYNLAFASGTVYEGMRIIELAREVRPPRLVVWGLDPDGILSLCSSQSNYDFSSTRLNPEFDEYEYYRLHLIGLTEARESIAVLCRAMRATPETPMRRGQLTRFSESHGTNTDRFAQLLSFQVHDGVQAGPLRDTGVPRLRRCLEQLQAAGTRVVLFFPPMHATRHELYFRSTAVRRHSETCLRELMACVQDLNNRHSTQPAIEVWDFRGFTSYHAEPIPRAARASMNWHWEAVHIRQELGDLVLSRIFEGELRDGDFGVKLSADNLEQHLSNLLQQREVYVRTHPEQIEVVAAAERIAANPAH